MIWFLGLVLFIGIIMAGLVLLTGEQVKNDNIFYVTDNEPCDSGPCSNCTCRMKENNVND